MVTTTRRGDTPPTELIATRMQELREALAAAKISVETLLRQDIALEPEMQQEFLKRIHKACGQCHRLVTGIEAVLLPSPAKTGSEMMLQKTSSALAP